MKGGLPLRSAPEPHTQGSEVPSSARRPRRTTKALFWLVDTTFTHLKSFYGIAVTSADKFRLVTRSDFDGLACAVLMKEQNLIDDVLFVHPKDMQDGKVDVDEWDILTNLPYVPGCHLAFDHHASETIRLGDMQFENHVIDPEAPSAARVVYDYFGGDDAFPNVSHTMMAAVDKADSAQFSRDEILQPHGWTLLSFLMDSRTGLGRFRKFRISNYQLMLDLVDACQQHDVDEILAMPDVRERVELYFAQEEQFKKQICRCAKEYGDLVTLNLLDEDPIQAGNRFMVYALYPRAAISIHVIPGRQRKNTVFAIGKSILNRTSEVNVGELCLEYDGGGHKNAGACQVSNESAASVLRELIARITAESPNTQSPRSA